jgi:hypothetical protein
MLGMVFSRPEYRRSEPAGAKILERPAQFRLGIHYERPYLAIDSRNGRPATSNSRAGSDGPAPTLIASSGPMRALP